MSTSDQSAHSDPNDIEMTGAEPLVAEPAGNAADVPFILGGRLLHRPTRAGSLTLGILFAAILLPVRGLMNATGSSMEEGFMLVFPRMVQRGKVPNVDFLHLYGPGSLDILAVWYWVLGYTLDSERWFGLLQHVGIILAVYAITRLWGRLVALVSAGTAMFMVLTPIGLSALAWHGAIALGLWAVVFGVRARALAGEGSPVVDLGRSRRNWVIAGVLAGLALTFRPDLAVAILVAGTWLVWRRGVWKRAVIGAAVGLIPMWVHFAIAGIGPSLDGMLLDPVFRLRPGRSLPVPPSWGKIDGALQAVAEGVPPWWPFPALQAEKQLFIWFFLVVIVAVLVPVVAWRRRRGGELTPQTMALMATGLFGVAIVQQALQRPDSTHLAWVSCVSWPLLVPIVSDAVKRRSPTRNHLTGPVVASALVALLMFVVCPFYTYRHYVLHSRVAVGDLPTPFLVERGDKQFWFGDFYVASAGQQMVNDLDRLSKPGDRLVVGPADLSRTIYSDVAFYFMFDELEPATYYVEMDPGLADKAGSGLAEDLRTADWVVLTNFWTGWYEPNASSDWGSEEANQVIADDFCLVGNYEDALVLLYQRCEVGDGVSPAEVSDRPPPEGGAKP